MQITCDAIIHHPRKLVYETYRDKLTELLPYLPNIRGIEIKKREQDGNIVKFVNVWHGGGDIPTIARAFLSESMLAWTDFATWREDAFECDWRTETHAFTEAVTSQGMNRYFEVDGGTRLEIRGDMTIDAAKIKGVPRLLAGKVGRAVEEFLVKTISKNLLDVSKGLERYLNEQAKG
jgi:hypothetical protein